ncbi:MAG: family 10 glycosylhydrolase [Proteobacteria bacterium]|nr:family 10 glycosylhydrolase [Pseudomonadota bacterium]
MPKKHSSHIHISLCCLLFLLPLGCSLFPSKNTKSHSEESAITQGSEPAMITQTPVIIPKEDLASSKDNFQDTTTTVKVQNPLCDVSCLADNVIARQTRHNHRKKKPISYNKSSSQEYISTETPFQLPRGVWISSVNSSVYDSQEEMKHGLTKIEKLGANGIFPVIWNKQDFYFNSQTVTNNLGEGFIKFTDEGDDILETITSLAKTEGLTVYPSIESGLKAVLHQDGDPTLSQLGEIVTNREDWLVLNRQGEILKMCHFDVCFGYLNLLQPDVRMLLLNLVTELVSDYNIDGVLFDDHFSYPAYSVGCDPLIEKNPELKSRFASWQELNSRLSDLEGCRLFSNKIRQEAIVSFFKEAKKITATHGKKLILSPAGIPSWSKNEWLQDWQLMVEKNYLDGVIMQVFRDITYRFMANSPELHNIDKHIPLGVVILLGLKDQHYFAYGERIYRQTRTALEIGKSPSYYYHEMIDIPVEGYSQDYRNYWIQQTKNELSQ